MLCLASAIYDVTPQAPRYSLLPLSETSFLVSEYEAKSIWLHSFQSISVRQEYPVIEQPLAHRPLRLSTLLARLLYEGPQIYPDEEPSVSPTLVCYAFTRRKLLGQPIAFGEPLLRFSEEAS
ncbi:hypothetical protein BAUCODRAFT_121221 [Baudoinia panamericana UAMH 10762]|uniref:Uncharacterized protein n=1 Tax=Baudoinia panamericana (strain UAMH 10762) TaxID=717646 RepID=M2LUR4_BAUPA|nr:uncharacterized protein BAUCODRAFT_121221 [Baudoinia panamericana UAMH 10762]EMC98347.1 hypothetical protein BAUCODRAFT_121221 [Baudoinia panamericana UAMH 10762]